MKTFTALLCALYVAGSLPVRADERALEGYAIDVPSVSAAMEDSRRLNAESHYAGTPGDAHIAQWMRDQLANDGFDASLEAFSYDVPYLRNAKLTLLAKPQITFDLHETPIAVDPDATRSGTGIPFNAGSGSGNVVGSVVDAGHGIDADYTALANRHIDVRTRIVLVRYGKQFRGLLAQRAQARGAAGVIFFSDPADRDGSLRGPAYPDGPYRPLGSVQRGSVGDPQLKIPTLPVTATVAARILAAMSDGITATPVRLHVDMVIQRKTLWNSVGVLQGRDPTHVVVLGAHRDAWVYGVTDNGAGVTTLLETARALGYLARSGWRPQFSIVVAGFDGEEIGEAGSNAYVRMHESALRSGCVAYINQDENTTGQFFAATAAAALENIFTPATQAIRDPREERRTLYARWQKQKGGVQIEGPAGGSDFEPFLYDLGIPVVDFGFEGVFGAYHSGIDDLRFASTQADPGFANHRTSAQLVALLAMRLASGAVPYRLAAYAPRMQSALHSIAQGHTPALAPMVAAVGRLAYRAGNADRRGIDGNVEITVARRLDLLFYGRNGYAAVPFPDVSAAIASNDNAAILIAATRTARALDGISDTIAKATHR